VADELCSRCGWVLGETVTACPACGEALAHRRSGFETAYFPAAAVQEDAGEAPSTGPDGKGRVDPVATGTSLIHEDDFDPRADSLELKAQPLLTCRGGPTSGRRLNLGRPTTTVGRLGAEITIEDPTLSGLHFAIEERGHEFFLRDLGSTNGTFLNGHIVRSAPLESGDEIRAGESVFVFSVVDVIPCS
jgi:hypothetical protein